MDTLISVLDTLLAVLDIITDVLDALVDVLDTLISVAYTRWTPSRYAEGFCWCWIEGLSVVADT